MPDLSTITQVIQLGMEATSTQGTAVKAARLMQAMQLDTKVMSNVDSFRPSGTKYNTVLAEEREWMEASMKGAPTYTELIYPLASFFTNVSPTQYLDGITATGVYKWLFQPSSTAADTTRTFTVEEGNATRAHLFSFGQFTEFAFNFTREKVEMSGKMIGQKLTDNITLTSSNTEASVGCSSGLATLTSATASVTNIGRSVTGTNIPTGAVIIACSPGVNYTMSAVALGTTASQTITFPAPSTVPLLPVTGSQISVFLDTTSGGLGTTRLTRLFDGKLSLANRFAPVWPVDASQASFASLVETPINGTFKAVVEADTQGMGTIFPLLGNSNTMFMRILCQSPLSWYSAGVYAGNAFLRPQLIIDCAVKVKSAGDFKDSGGVFAHDVEFELVHDGTWGRAIQVQVDNQQLTL